MTQTGSRRAPVHGSGTVVVESIDSDSSDDDDNVEGFYKGALPTLKNSYPLKIMVPSHASDNNCKWIYPITFGGGLVGGDAIEMTFHVKKNCCALVTGQESTKIYHCEDGVQTSQTLTGTVDKGALLCILSDPVVCYKDASFFQKQVLKMSRGGNLVYLDWVIGGRVALDELWLLHSYGNRTDIYFEDKLVYRDNYMLHDTPDITIRDAMKSFQVLGSCVILGSKLETVCFNLNKKLGKKKEIGEKNDHELVCSVSPLRYTVNELTVSGIYIRFMASTSTKAYDSVVSHIVEELTNIIGGNPFDDKY